MLCIYVYIYSSWLLKDLKKIRLPPPVILSFPTLPPYRSVEVTQSYGKLDNVGIQHIHRPDGARSSDRRHYRAREGYQHRELYLRALSRVPRHRHAPLHGLWVNDFESKITVKILLKQKNIDNLFPVNSTTSRK